MKFCPFVASLYPHMFTSFGRFILIFIKMALIFLEVLIIFCVSSFEFQQVRYSDCLDFMIASLLMSGPNSPNLNPLDYEIYGQC